ncbi:MAG TPA: NCS2 family permease [Candidatus Saccharimonadales bacterium]|nr:NCS2 family permease [Candidatus Saccharimonadales bacterium]
MDGIARYFKFAERGTTLATETKAGVTTFMVMAYILFLNPAILSNMFGAPGSPEAAAFIPAAAAATALVAGLLTLAMGIIANTPIALAAGLGINGAVAFGLVLTQGLTPAGAMGVIVLEGIVVTILVLVGLRESIMRAVPLALKRAIGVGIGLFILFIGFIDAGIIVKTAGSSAENPVPVTFVFPTTPAQFLFWLGLLITVALYARRVPAALLISILVTTVIAILIGVQPLPTTFVATPSFSTLGQFDITNVFTVLGGLAAILTIFSFMLTDFFDTMGTATAISEQAGLVEEDGQPKNVGRILLVDSVAAAAGGAAGISSNTSYIESAAGVAEGGRTGFTSVVTGVLFLAAILLTPLAVLVPYVATGPVLVFVGFLMVGLIKDIDFSDIEEGFPALLGLILMPLTFSITVGIGAAFVAYVVIKIVMGKLTQVHPLLWAVAVAFLIYFLQAWITPYLA